MSGFRENDKRPVALFDVAGVLVPFSGGPESILPGHTAAWSSWTQAESVQRFERGMTSPERFAREVIEELDLRTDTRTFLDDFETWPLGLADGTSKLLKEIRSIGFRIATLSNTNELHWRAFRDEYKLETLIEHHFPSFRTGKLKPNEAAYSQIVEAFEVEASDVYFVDDGKRNVDAAISFGFNARQVSSLEDAGAALFGWAKNSDGALTI